MRESQIEEKVVKWAREHGFLTPKVKFVENGYPDRLFISPAGHTIFLEFKVPGEVPTAIQDHRMSELRKRGIPALWSDNYVGAIRILGAALEEATVGPTQLPEASNKVVALPGISRPLPRSWPRENKYRPSGVQAAEGEGAGSEDADNSPPEAGPEDVA